MTGIGGEDIKGGISSGLSFLPVILFGASVKLASALFFEKMYGRGESGWSREVMNIILRYGNSM